MISVPIDNILPLEDLEKNLPDLVKKTHGKDFYVFTRDNKPIVALMGVDYLEDLTENTDKIIEGDGPKQKISSKAPIMPHKNKDDKFNPNIRAADTKLGESPKTDKPRMPIFPKSINKQSAPLNNQPPVASFSKPAATAPTTNNNNQIPTITITPPKEVPSQTQTAAANKPAPQDTLLGISANGVMPPQNNSQPNKSTPATQSNNPTPPTSTDNTATPSINQPSTPPFLANKDAANNTANTSSQSPMSKMGITSAPVNNDYDSGIAQDGKSIDSNLVNPSDQASPAQYSGDGNNIENPLATSTATNGMRDLNLNKQATNSPSINSTQPTIAPSANTNSSSTPTNTIPTTTQVPNTVNNTTPQTSTPLGSPAASPAQSPSTGSQNPTPGSPSTTNPTPTSSATNPTNTSTASPTTPATATPTNPIVSTATTPAQPASSSPTINPSTANPATTTPTSPIANPAAAATTPATTPATTAPTVNANPTPNTTPNSPDTAKKDSSVQDLQID